MVVEVRDTGVGMDEAVRSRVFEPFFTTKDVGKGSGLGLSQVYGFVSQSDGRVRLESAPGEGTAFHLLLPASDLAAEAPRRDARSGKLVGGTERILLVEDDATVLALTLDVLTGVGYQVTTATNAAEALAVLQSEHEIDLLFTDVVMPGGVSGLSLARAARELRPSLRVLLTSGFLGENRVIDGREPPAGQALRDRRPGLDPAPTPRPPRTPPPPQTRIGRGGVGRRPSFPAAGGRGGPRAERSEERVVERESLLSSFASLTAESAGGGSILRA